MNNQEKSVPQLAQEANEDFAILDEELLDAVTGRGDFLGCLTCFTGKNEEPRAVQHVESPNLIKNEHGQVAALHEVFRLWEQENPASPGTEGSQQPINWSPKKVTLSTGQTGYVKSPGAPSHGFHI